MRGRRSAGGGAGGCGLSGSGGRGEPGAADTKPEQYRIQVSDTEAGSEVRVLNLEGAPEKSVTATKILSLLYDQLK